MRRCPICQATIHRHRFMCVFDWGRLPDALQTAVNYAWERYRIELALRPRDPKSFLARARELQEAQRAAVDHLKPAPLPAVFRSNRSAS